MFCRSAWDDLGVKVKMAESPSRTEPKTTRRTERQPEPTVISPKLRGGGSVISNAQGVQSDESDTQLHIDRIVRL